jgi:chromosome segregation ATPase
MNTVKTKLQEEKAAIEKLQQSKQLLEQEIVDAQKDSDDFHKEIKELKQKLIKLLLDNKLDSFLPKYEKYYVKLSKRFLTAVILNIVRCRTANQTKV